MASTWSLSRSASLRNPQSTKLHEGRTLLQANPECSVDRRMAVVYQPCPTGRCNPNASLGLVDVRSLCIAFERGGVANWGNEAGRQKQFRTG